MFKRQLLFIPQRNLYGFSHPVGCTTRLSMLMILRHRKWARALDACITAEWDGRKKNKNNPLYASPAVASCCLTLLMWIITRANRSLFYILVDINGQKPIPTSSSIALNPFLFWRIYRCRRYAKVNYTDVWTSLPVPKVWAALVRSEDFTTSSRDL